jgi:hypothetical protein
MSADQKSSLRHLPRLLAGRRHVVAQKAQQVGEETGEVAE